VKDQKLISNDSTSAATINLTILSVETEFSTTELVLLVVPEMAE